MVAAISQDTPEMLAALFGQQISQEGRGEGTTREDTSPRGEGKGQEELLASL